MTINKPNRIKQASGEYAFDIAVYVILIVLIIIMLYPFIYVISISISAPTSVIRGEVYLLPKGFDLSAYRTMLQHPLFFPSYLNTIWYTISGTMLTLTFTALAAYPLSLDSFASRSLISKLYIFTMFFSGGMIPTFITIRNLGMYNTRLALILPGVVSAWNVIIMRSFFRTIPPSLRESAHLDGAGEWKILALIIIPLSKPVLSTIGLFSALYYWNDFFSTVLYVTDGAKYPVQMILRMILIGSSFSMGLEQSTYEARTLSTMSLKAASIVLTSLPIMCVYPFVQKYFVKGIMIGSVKG